MFYLQAYVEREFEEEEVKVVLLDCGGVKDPGPDGFNFLLSKQLGMS